MIDSTERQALADVLIRCISDKNGWDRWSHLNAFLTKNPHPFRDKAILGIGFEFMTILDPEWLCNLTNLTHGLVFRTLLFLYSNREYIEPKDPRPWWRKVLDFVGVNCILFLGILGCSVFGVFYGFLSALLFLILFGFVYTMLFKILHTNKQKTSLPEDEEVVFWPFASREEYQNEKVNQGQPPKIENKEIDSDKHTN